MAGQAHVAAVHGQANALPHQFLGEPAGPAPGLQWSIALGRERAAGVPQAFHHRPGTLGLAGLQQAAGVVAQQPAAVGGGEVVHQQLPAALTGQAVEPAFLQPHRQRGVGMTAQEGLHLLRRGVIESPGQLGIFQIDVQGIIAQAPLEAAIGLQPALAQGLLGFLELVPLVDPRGVLRNVGQRARGRQSEPEQGQPHPEDGIRTTLHAVSPR